MTDPTHTHEPSPEFRTFLEWQVASTLRREARFAAPVRRVRFGLHTVMIALVSVALGAAAAVGSAQVAENRERAVLLETARNEIAIANLRISAARARFEHMREQFDRGAIGRESLYKAEAELRDVEAQLTRLQLNATEIQATGAPARDEITAPAVNGRDFVTERLQLNASLIQEQLAAAERLVADAERRVAVGAIHRLALDEAQLEVMRIEAEMSLLVRTLEMRKLFLQGKMEPASVNTELTKVKLTRELEVMQRQIDLSRSRLELLEQRHRVGQVNEVEVLRARLELQERELLLQSLRNRLHMLNRVP